MSMNYANVSAANNAMSQANAAAQQSYNRAMLQYQNEQLAFQKAAEAWKETMDKAGLTGMYEGQATQPALTNWANLFGTWAQPTTGEQTLAAQQQQFAQGQDVNQQAMQWSQLMGSYVAPGQLPGADAQTLAAQQQAQQNAATVAGLT